MYKQEKGKYKNVALLLIPEVIRKVVDGLIYSFAFMFLLLLLFAFFGSATPVENSTRLQAGAFHSEIKAAIARASTLVCTIRRPPACI
ncbi:MAG: hypothetical protein LPK19_03890 [Hymenobacteraceae bacterium]|nr:hypothetical protein [Hymenobacteraceae bacterium]MDX5511387.1 hypothetical protein [Hymenobacteraceae bacterium]